ncbi:hypothetical protein C8T65DRAFT_649660 [Cerioporus squamosus]|nr:hypothetical protein C8T65DRAFT_649660 [Cerioporus squamosus]
MQIYSCIPWVLAAGRCLTPPPLFIVRMRWPRSTSVEGVDPWSVGARIRGRGDRSSWDDPSRILKATTVGFGRCSSNLALRTTRTRVRNSRRTALLRLVCVVSAPLTRQPQTDNVAAAGVGRRVNGGVVSGAQRDTYASSIRTRDRSIWLDSHVGTRLTSLRRDTGGQVCNPRENCKMCAASDCVCDSVRAPRGQSEDAGR